VKEVNMYLGKDTWQLKAKLESNSIIDNINVLMQKIDDMKKHLEGKE